MLHKEKILIIHKSKVNREKIAVYLRELQYAVIIADNIEEVYNLAWERPDNPEAKAEFEGFVHDCVESFRAIRPFFDFMSEILTHDLNGEPLY